MSHVAFRLAYSHLTVDHPKGQSHAHFDYEYLANGDRKGRHCYWPQIESRIHFLLAYLHLTLVHYKGKVKVMHMIHISTVNISETMTDTANIAFGNK